MSAMAGAKNTSSLLKQLRGLMKNTKYVSEELHAYIVPSSDSHSSEYLAECDERRAFVTGFTGSAGTAVVTGSQACLWTDGRYYLQARREMDENWTLMKDGTTGTPTQGEWLSSSLPAGGVVGVDPRLLSSQAWDTLAGELRTGGLALRPVSTNLVDLAWTDRPPRTANAILPHPLKHTGMSVKQKLEAVRTQMRQRGCSLLVLAALDEIAYLLNLRGSDIVYNPVFFSYCAVQHESVHVFVNKQQLSGGVAQHFVDEGVSDQLQIHDYDHVWSFLKEQAGALEGKVWLCPLSSHALSSTFESGQRLVERTPPCTMKAVKNEVEVQGLKAAHVRDAAALCTYLCWLQEQVAQGATVTEVSGAAKLDALRAEQDLFVSLSFSTISSSGPNGAVIHYHPSEATDRPITADEIYLVDSGAQYRDGTTDVTRTVHFGQPTKFQKECFTRVLKGNIALATAIFPEKTRGTLLDPLARHALWEVGLDYSHGTGHGIGSFLNVHEGPITIHSRPQPPSEAGLQAGMFVSDEPGYYEDGQFGIRIENIVQVVAASTPHHFRGRQFLTFDHVTMVPIQTSLLLPELLTQAEISWLNDYHSQCRDLVAPLLEAQGRTATYQWLLKQTEPLG